MKKKLVAALLCLAMTASLCACGGGNNSTDNGGANNKGAQQTNEDSGEDADVGSAGGETAEEEPVVTTEGPDDAVAKMEMWSFVELHNTFYADMLKRWNEANPDKTIQITFTTYPYGDMHSKLLLSLQSGTGAPDICDVEVGQFPNIVEGLDTWLYPLNDALSPYENTLVKSRLETYSGSDGNYYGAPFHVGATVMYYNEALLEEYGLSSEGIETWDQYTELGEKLKEASDGKVCLTSVDTASVDWMWLAMAEFGEDWTGGFDGEANVQLESVKKMAEMQKKWLDDGLAMVSPDGHVDLEAGFQNIMDHNIASFPKAMWYMSRFLNYMPEESGNWTLAPCPVFEKGQPNSVGIGGTGTVVTQQSENKELAAEFLCFAKCSEEGEKEIWNQLGFDTCNTAIWSDESITKDESNQYIAYFRTNPFDVLNEIKDNIGKISVVPISPTINEQLCNVTLNDIFENGKSVDDALQEAQDVVSLEQ